MVGISDLWRREETLRFFRGWSVSQLLLNPFSSAMYIPCSPSPPLSLDPRINWIRLSGGGAQESVFYKHFWWFLWTLEFENHRFKTNYGGEKTLKAIVKQTVISNTSSWLTHIFSSSFRHQLPLTFNCVLHIFFGMCPGLLRLNMSTAKCPITYLVLLRDFPATVNGNSILSVCSHQMLPASPLSPFISIQLAQLQHIVDPWTMWRLGVQALCAVKNLHYNFIVSSLYLWFHILGSNQLWIL